MVIRKMEDGTEWETGCEGSGNCCDCSLFDCYHNDTIDPDMEGMNWNAEMDIMEKEPETDNWLTQALRRV